MDRGRRDMRLKRLGSTGSPSLSDSFARGEELNEGKGRSVVVS